jgi:hypothetical protein
VITYGSSKEITGKEEAGKEDGKQEEDGAHNARRTDARSRRILRVSEEYGRRESPDPFPEIRAFL